MSAFTQWQASSRDLAKKFRLGLDLEACQEMVDFLPGLLAVVNKSLSSAQILQLQQLIANMLTSQENQDWLGLADSLEYELVEWLDTVQQRSQLTNGNPI